MIPTILPTLPTLAKYISYLKKIWQRKRLTNNGKLHQLLEKKLKTYLGENNVLLVTNGTLALQLILKTFDLKGEVITTPFTFAATTNVIFWERLKPVFADIDPETFNIEPKSVMKRITKKTSAILAVHTFGNPCKVEELEKIAQKYKLKLIFDSAHAFSVEYKGKPITTYGDASALSFHATKVFQTIEGGAIVVKNKKLFKKLQLLRNFGIDQKTGNILLPGINAKMNEFQAAMGLCNLNNLKKNIFLRKQRYEFYKKQLRHQKGIYFQKIIASRYNYPYMPIYFDSAKKREAVRIALKKEGFETKKYFYPLTSNSLYLSNHFNSNVKFSVPIANLIAKKILCLPLYPGLPMVKIKHICEIIKKLYETKGQYCYSNL